MRVDVVTVFPEYLAPLELSLIGRARERGLLDVNVHDLRRWTHDVHHSVDGPPAGGGAGMVMKPQPWGECLDELVFDAGEERPHLLVTSPAGRPFTQEAARELAAEPWLMFACGRYEGIDQRVIDHASERMAVTEVSIGDYVLFGGEVAVLAIVEAVARLLPGSSAMPPRWRTSRTTPGSWRPRRTRARPSGAATRCRRCCCRATTPRSTGGDATRRCCAPPRSDPICWQDRRALASTNVTGAYSKGPGSSCPARVWQISIQDRRDVPPVQAVPLPATELYQRGLSSMNVLDELNAASMRADVPDFRPGDTVKVHVRVQEGARSRVQVFQGVVIRRHGAGIGETFTVRKISYGIGVERTFPVHGPMIDRIEVAMRGKVRRAKLYYLRGRKGKAATKIKEKRDV
ncbi:hypothetical protein GCM10029992_64010 [Glycomyces albus]